MREPVPQKAKRPYFAPALVVYGPVSTLTTKAQTGGNRDGEVISGMILRTAA